MQGVLRFLVRDRVRQGKRYFRSKDASGNSSRLRTASGSVSSGRNCCVACLFVGVACLFVGVACVVGFHHLVLLYSTGCATPYSVIRIATYYMRLILAIAFQSAIVSFVSVRSPKTKSPKSVSPPFDHDLFLVCGRIFVFAGSVPARCASRKLVERRCCRD